MSVTDRPPDRRVPPPFVGRPGPTAYHRLNPLTRLVAAIAVAADASLLGGVAAPLALLAVGVLLPAALAGVLGRLLRLGLPLALPLVASAVVVNALFFPGSGPTLQLGPLRASQEGLAFGLAAAARVLALAGAAGLFALTIEPAALAADLERRGLPRRVAFVAHTALALIPSVARRAAATLEARQARGLDVESGLLARLRAVPALAGPLVLGLLHESEERALALEARGFARGGRRTLLWAPADSGAQAAARWLLLASMPACAALRLAGVA